MNEMTFWDHVDEIRGRSLHTLIAVIIVMGAVFYLYDYLFPLVRDLFLPKEASLIVITPFEALSARIKISFMISIVLSLPLILYQAHRFLSPAFSLKSKKYVYLMLMLFLILFFSGVAFSFFWLIPLTFKFLLAFAHPYTQPLLSLDAVVNIVVLLMLGTTLCFQIPLVMIILTLLNITSHRTYRERRRHFILVLVIATAIITPDPTGVTMLLLMAPLIVLYEFGIIIVKRIGPLTDD